MKFYESPLSLWLFDILCEAFHLFEYFPRLEKDLLFFLFRLCTYRLKRNESAGILFLKGYTGTTKKKSLADSPWVHKGEADFLKVGNPVVVFPKPQCRLSHEFAKNSLLYNLHHAYFEQFDHVEICFDKTLPIFVFGVK